MTELLVAVQLLGNKPGERIGIVKFHETGYYPATIDRKEWSAAQVKAAIAEFNLEQGIPQDVAESALYGSMFGWHVPAAARAILFAAGQEGERQ